MDQTVCLFWIDPDFGLTSFAQICTRNLKLQYKTNSAYLTNSTSGTIIKNRNEKSAEKRSLYNSYRLGWEEGIALAESTKSIKNLNEPDC